MHTDSREKKLHSKKFKFHPVPSPLSPKSNKRIFWSFYPSSAPSCTKIPLRKSLILKSLKLNERIFSLIFYKLSTFFPMEAIRRKFHSKKSNFHSAASLLGLRSYEWIFSLFFPSSTPFFHINPMKKNSILENEFLPCPLLSRP